MGMRVCYGLMSFITFQSNTRLEAKYSAGRKAISPRSSTFTLAILAVRISQASRSGPLLELASYPEPILS
jgi:hypothetical protein